MQADILLLADGSGPASDPFPAPHTFMKANLLAAYHQSKRMSQAYSPGEGATYPKPWMTGGVNSGFIEFPILVSGQPYIGGDPGRFRILVAKDGKFHQIVMHMYSPKSWDGTSQQEKSALMSEMMCYGAPVTRRSMRFARTISLGRKCIAP
jgi:hypothetical protein